MVAHKQQQQQRISPERPSSSRPPHPPQPMDVQNAAPPPFLQKTYEMVDDPSTDPIVSWNNAGNSFVVWNANDFSKELLPKSFKHSNFSSFVRQLNTYGFRKVDPDRWEFANEGFLKGQKQLLKGIHRRRPASSAAAAAAAQPSQESQQASKPACVEVGKFGIEEEIDRLKRDKNVLMTELVRLRQHQQQTDRDLQLVLQRLHVTEQRQQQMISFLAKAMQSPSFLAQLVQQNEKKNRLATAARKKRRLPKQDKDSESGFDDEGPSSPGENHQIVKYQPNSNDPVAMLMQYLNSPDLSPKVDLPNLEVTFRDRMMGEFSPSRLMKDLELSEDEMQGTSPLSLMRFESVDAGESSGVSGGGGGVEIEDGAAASLDEMAAEVAAAAEVAGVAGDEFEWDQFLASAGSEIDMQNESEWWGGENGTADNVDELTQQIRQLSSSS